MHCATYFILESSIAHPPPPANLDLPPNPGEFLPNQRIVGTNHLFSEWKSLYSAMLKIGKLRMV
jgi:hypothetical protein